MLIDNEDYPLCEIYSDHENDRYAVVMSEKQIRQLQILLAHTNSRVLHAMGIQHVDVVDLVCIYEAIQRR